MKKISKLLTALTTVVAFATPLATLTSCSIGGDKPQPTPPVPPEPVDPRIPRDDLIIESNILKGLKPDADISQRTTLEIPSDVIYIQHEAFKSAFIKDGPNSNIVNLTFANDNNSVLRSISEHVFDGCTAFQNALVLPSSLENIGSYAFSNTSFSTVQLNNGLKNIGESIFEGSTIANEKLTIPATVIGIAPKAFKDCKNLKGTLEILNSDTIILSETFANCGFTFLDITKFEDLRSVRFTKDCFKGFPKEIVVATQFAGEDLESFIEKLKRDYSGGSIETVTPASLTTADDFNITVNNDGQATINGLKEINETSAKDTLYFPSTYTENGQEYPITSIADGAFKTISDKYSNISIIYFPDDSNIVTIGTEAFANAQFTNCYETTSIALTLPVSLKNIGASAFAGSNLQCTLSTMGHIDALGEHAFEVLDTADLYVTPEFSGEINEIPANTFAKCNVKFNEYYNIVISNQILHENSLAFKNIAETKIIVLSSWSVHQQAIFDGNPFNYDFTKAEGKIQYVNIREQVEYDAANYVLLSNNIVSPSWLSHYNKDVGFIKNDGPTTVSTTRTSLTSGNFVFILGYELPDPRGLKCEITSQHGSPVVEGHDLFKVEIDSTKIKVEGKKVTVPVSFVEGYIANLEQVFFTLKFSYTYDNQKIWEQSLEDIFILKCGALLINFTQTSTTSVSMKNAAANAAIVLESDTEILSKEDINISFITIQCSSVWTEAEMTCDIADYSVKGRTIEIRFAFTACGGDLEKYEYFKLAHSVGNIGIALLISDTTSDWTEVLMGNPTAISVRCE